MSVVVLGGKLCSNEGGAIGAVGINCEGCDIFPKPKLLFDIGKLEDIEELFIISGGGGTVGGLMGGDLLSPVSRRLFAMRLMSTSSGRSRFRLGIIGIEGWKDG